MDTISIAASTRAHLVGNYARLRQRLARRLGCVDLAADCLHDVWLKLSRPVEADVANADAYVWRMLCHTATDHLRSQRPSVSLDDPDIDALGLADAGRGPQAAVEARSELARLDRALEGLSRRQRAVLIAVRVEQRSRRDVADWLGVSIRTVDTALHEALAHCSAYCGRKGTDSALSILE
ncbi:RNA polymerase sigma factor [Pigmentiphaga sp. GD03639]|jgi:RNA polymerase sigma-70 factor (ECF subfamily)|uniref:RNA polymerase sigma-70 factor, ECF subfamily n=1 Tax=Pigmentiphaga daeguensis TaxID=414049 RepID=A0ABN1C5G6_9BURK|nr:MULTISPECIES: RNA polymerase sigma factor [unclassified Pigmentiphaga]MDH2238469.1 RNA polymerase sigma factor [Pigmentiphaga sp. GD03639]OVZ66396.1 hypothetical protein CDO46_00955 [Pigmentiphaga sp. NML030171]